MKSQNRFKMIVSWYAIIVNDGMVLLSRRFQTGYWDGWYSLPAGHVDDGESVYACTIREAKEEIGIVIPPDGLRFAHAMHRKETDIRFDVFFFVTQYRGTIENMEPHRCGELRWFPKDKLPDNTIPYIRTALQHAFSGVLYSDFGWDRK